jgi:hypothetical protein
MLPSQRILLAVSLLLIAWVLHVSLCDWVINGPIMGGDGGQRPIWSWHEVRGAPGAIPTYTGVYTQRHAGRTESLLLGIIVPLLLITLVVYLYLGWRRDRRVACGLCAACGYDLRGVPESTRKCPECGTTPGS